MQLYKPKLKNTFKKLKIIWKTIWKYFFIKMLDFFLECTESITHAGFRVTKYKGCQLMSLEQLINNILLIFYAIFFFCFHVPLNYAYRIVYCVGFRMDAFRDFSFFRTKKIYTIKTLSSQTVTWIKDFIREWKNFIASNRTIKAWNSF